MSKQTLGFLLGAVLIVLVAAAPVISVAIASGVASSLGCDLDEGNIHPCLFQGIDLGGTLYTMFVLGWLMLATLPLGVLALATLILTWTILAVQNRRRATAEREQN